MKWVLSKTLKLSDSEERVQVNFSISAISTSSSLFAKFHLELGLIFKGDIRVQILPVLYFFLLLKSLNFFFFF